MLSQYFQLPEFFAISGDTELTLSLKDAVSDFALLQALRTPLLEFVVAEVGDSIAILVRVQAGFVLHDKLSDTQEPVSDNQVLYRGLGQGLRLYACGHSPVKLVGLLRQGLSLKISVKKMNLAVWLPGSNAFELVALETDLRLADEPAALKTAKTLLAREPGYGTPANELALLITELELARRELNQFMVAVESHSGLVSEAMGLEPLLAQRRQWLLREYAQTQERLQFNRSANEQFTDVESLRRRLTCYELLCPPEINAMVQALAEEN